MITYVAATMTRNSSLSTFLMISIAVIVTGILLVIFTQLEQSQLGYTTPTSIEQEQSNIIEHVYKIRSTQEMSSTTAQPLQTRQTAPVMTPENIIKESPKQAPLSADATKILQEQVDVHLPSQTVPQFNNAYDVWTNTSKQSIEPYYSLKNNPWSPDYKPGY